MSKSNNDKNNNGEFRHYDRMVKQAEKKEKAGKTEAKGGAVPLSCKQCAYYQPGFKYRKCLFAECYYRKDINVFRRKPHVKDRYS
ncbi:MAG: hypothetical protein LUH07_16080 [Lachnospiraceae bacterium]|nr:hypothetical protein [Lachnospiraceae bacterium]